MICYHCEKETMTIEKEECFFCDGTGKSESGKECGVCDSEYKVTIVYCSNEECILYDDGEDDE